MPHTPPQRRKCWSGACIIALLLSSLGGFSLPHSLAQETPPGTLQHHMQHIFQALTSVFSFSLNETQFQAVEHQPTIRTALGTLAAQASQIEHHGRGSVSTFDFLRRSLVRDAQEALQLFEQQQYPAARFLVQQLTENCFACHAKLPASRRSVLGERFMASTDLAGLSVKERARLAVATRQFHTALELYEALLQAPTIPAGDIDLMGAFEDYLKVAIRVQNDFVRPIITLQRFLQRQDVALFLRQHLTDWLDAFRGIESTTPDGDIFTRARRLIQEGQGRNRFPADRRGLVHFVVASGLLHRYLEADITEALRVAQAYYLLGITESYLSRSLWRAETEFFLETAIRSAPGSQHAREAYDFLENYVIARYTGSAGLHMPLEVQQHLAELRQLRDR